MNQDSELKILLIEDDPIDAALIMKALKESPYGSTPLVWVKCLADAKKMGQEYFGLLLLDLGLPDSDRSNTMTQMRNYFPDSAIIVVTGLANDDLALEAFRQGAQSYVTKDEINDGYLSRTIQTSLERHKIVQQLKATEKRLVEAQAVAKVGSWETDLLSLKVMWSLETYRIFELDPAQFKPTHTTFLDYVHSEDRLLVDTAFKTSFTCTGYYSIEHRLITGNGRLKWVEQKWRIYKDGSGNPIKAFGTCQDITERKQAEQQIQSEKFLSDAIINSLPGIFYMSDRDGRLLRWNHNLEFISEYGANEMKKMNPLDFVDEEERELMRSAINSVFLLDSADATCNLYTKSKKKIPYYFTGHKVKIGEKDFLVGVGIDISERARAEKELMEYTQEIKKLTAYLDWVREEERSRIAREIHDELGQQLTGLKMDATWVAKRILPEKKVHAKLIDIIWLIDQTIKTVRRISTDLRPGILDDLGLIAALEWQCGEFQKKSEIKCAFHSNIDDLAIEQKQATGIFRIYQESLTNVLRHAQATLIESTLKQSETEITLVVKDNGKGFDLSAVKKKETLGLIGMRERALILGGELHIESEPGIGTSVILRIPMSAITAKQNL